MRLLPILLIVLLAVFGVVLGLTVMWNSTLGASAKVGSMPPFLGGKPQGHVYTGVAGEPSDVNPLTTHDPLATRLVLPYTHDALLDQDPETGALRPALAEEYELAADGMSCTFRLRQGVLFSDSTPMTMADALFGWELSKAGHLIMGAIAQCFERVENVEVLDEWRFRVEFKGGSFSTANAVGLGWTVVHKKYFVGCVRSRLKDAEEMPEIGSARFAELLKQVKDQCGPGTGPYELINDPAGVSNWRRREEVLLTRNEHCWRRRVRPGSWNFAGIRTLFRDQAGAQNALLRGEVDWFAGGQPDRLLASQPQLAKDYAKFVYDYPALGAFRIIWNCKQKPFDDPRVRRAMGMLVNRTEMVAVFGGTAKPALAHAKLGTRAYPDLEPLPFDPGAARKLLRDAGYDPEKGTALRMNLLTYQGHEPTRRITELFASAAKDAGVELEVRARESSAVVAALKVGDWHGLLSHQGFAQWGDPYQFLNSQGLKNLGGWKHEEADRLTIAGRKELDADRRADLWRELHELADREQPAALIVHPLAAVLFNKHIEDCVVGPLGLKPNAAWVAPENQRK